MKLNKKLVPGRGLEPPRCYSLVPETSASTNSAIWASCQPKLSCFFASQQRLQSYQTFCGKFAVEFARVHLFVRGVLQLGCIAHSMMNRAGMKKATGDRWLQSNDLGKVCLNLVPRRGLEPPRLTSLPPQGSASTNSAIWADSFAYLDRKSVV